MTTTKECQIYLVDDDTLYLQTLEHTLKEEHKKKTELKAFSTGEECLRHIRENAPDIVILDYHLNSLKKDAMNGIRVLSKIKELNEDIQVIMLSQQEKLEVAVSSITSGAYDYVVKNETAFIRLRHDISLIRHQNELRKKMNQYVNWNIVMAALFLVFLVGMIVYAWRKASS